MKAAWYQENGAATTVLKVGDFPDPILGPGDVLVKVEASGVNPSDVKSRAGRPLIAPHIIPHSDGAGTILDVGADVSRSRIGQRVWLWNAQWRRPFGTAAELVALPQEQAVHLPDSLGFDEGACLGVPALTALHALTTDGGVLGKRVLIAGGAGAVGAYAVQMARLLGASSVITTVSTAEKAGIVKSLGADHVINYKTENTIDQVREITAGQGVDRIIEVDAASNVTNLPGMLAQDGLYVVFGSGKPVVPLDFRAMIGLGAGVRFFVVYAISADARKSCVNSLTSYLRANLLKHFVAEHYSLSDIAAAHSAVESGRVVGNVVVKL